jgi:hypothetical protein
MSSRSSYVIASRDSLGNIVISFCTSGSASPSSALPRRVVLLLDVDADRTAAGSRAPVPTRTGDDVRAFNDACGDGAGLGDRAANSATPGGARRLPLCERDVQRDHEKQTYLDTRSGDALGDASLVAPRSSPCTKLPSRLRVDDGVLGGVVVGDAREDSDSARCGDDGDESASMRERRRRMQHDDTPPAVLERRLRTRAIAEPDRGAAGGGAVAVV